jgi:hypothetical protein
MCNINAVFKKAGMNCTQRLSDMTAVSSMTNDTGEGIFLSSGHKVIKAKRLGFASLAKDITESKVVIAHERLATSGNTSLEMAHPFYNDRFVLFHNGVFNKGSFDWRGFCGKTGKSDTKIFFDSFISKFAEVNDIPKAINAALRFVNGGTYSVIIYDKKTDECYYFKNNFTDMHVMETADGCLVMTTNEKNLGFWEAKNELFIEPERIYRVKRTFTGYELPVVGKIESGYDYISEEIPSKASRKHKRKAKYEAVPEFKFRFFEDMVFPIVDFSFALPFILVWGGAKLTVFVCEFVLKRLMPDGGIFDDNVSDIPQHRGTPIRGPKRTCGAIPGCG